MGSFFLLLFARTDNGPLHVIFLWCCLFKETTSEEATCRGNHLMHPRESKRQRLHRPAVSLPVPPSGARLEGEDLSHVLLLAETCLDFVNGLNEAAPFDWTAISHALQQKQGGPRWGGMECQRMWKYVAYGQLFAPDATHARLLQKSTGSDASVGSLLTGPTASQSCELVASDEEEMVLDPTALTYQAVRPRVAVARPRAAAAPTTTAKEQDSAETTESAAAPNTEAPGK